jgi:hypothetical protein
VNRWSLEKCIPITALKKWIRPEIEDASRGLSLESEEAIWQERRFHVEGIAMKCPNCGAENPDNGFYCGSCAAQLRENRPLMGEANDRGRMAMGRKVFFGSSQRMQMDNQDGTLPKQSPWRDVNWTPLLIVIASAYLVGLARYGIVVYSYGSYSLETKVSVILSFLASTAFIATIALVIYRREDLSRLSLITGMVILVLLLAVGVTTYF